MPDDNKKVKEIVNKIRENLKKLKNTLSKDTGEISEIEELLKIEDEIKNSSKTSFSKKLEKKLYKINNYSHIYIDNLDNPRLLYILNKQNGSDYNYFLYLDKNLDIKFYYESYKKYSAEEYDAKLIKALLNKNIYDIYITEDIRNFKLTQGIIDYMLKNNIKKFEDVNAYKYLDYMAKNYIDEKRNISEKIIDEIKKQNFVYAIKDKVILSKDGDVLIFYDFDSKKNDNSIGKIKNNYDIYKIVENSYKEILMFNLNMHSKFSEC